MTEPTYKSYPNLVQSIGIAGILLLGMLLFIPVYCLLSKLIGKEASGLIFYLLAIGVSFWGICLIKKKKTGKNSYNFTVDNKRIIPYVIIIAIFLYIGIVIPICATIELLMDSEKAILNPENGIFDFVRYIIASPILEEMIFSGIILDGLLKKYTPKKSILVTSLLFGLIHLSPIQFISGFIIGIFTGYIYYKTRSITLSIIIHATGNITILLLNHFKIYGFLKYSMLHRVASIYTNIIFIILGSVSIIIVCVYFLRKEFNKKEEMAAHNRLA